MVVELEEAGKTIRAYRKGSTDGSNCREVARILQSVSLSSTFAKMIRHISGGNVTSVTDIVVVKD